MKRVVTIILCVIAIMAMAACTGINPNNDKYVGEWYWSEDPDLQTLSFTKEGEYLIDGEAVGTFEATADYATITDPESGEKWDVYLSDIDGYSCLNVEGSLFVKGYDNAVAYYEAYCYVDPSDIWAYDFSGEYYKAYDDSLSHLSEYEQMVEIKTGGGYTVNQHNGGFTLSDNYSGYRYGSMDHAITVDIDRENRTMKHIDSSGYIDREYSIEWCEETQEFYFNEESSLGDEYDTYWFRLSNVQ